MSDLTHTCLRQPCPVCHPQYAAATLLSGAVQAPECTPMPTMTDKPDIVERLREGVILDAFNDGRLIDGMLAERMVRERHEAADEIENLRRCLASRDDFLVRRDLFKDYTDTL